MKDNIKIMSTKLKMPAPRKNYIRREALIEKMNSILDYKITLIMGPAASGKTTLITAFINENSHMKFKWISLDKDNDDLFSFWYYFLEAVKEYLGESSNVIFDSFNAIISKNDIDNLLSMIINALNSDTDYLIVFDDFQYISGDSLLGTVEYFIKHCSNNVHIIVLSREQPRMYLSDLAMAGELLEISEEELKFSEAEGRTFLKDTLRLHLESEYIKKINNLSEGWVGGMQLIAIALNNKKLNEFKVLNRYMTEYLANEILDSLDEEKRSFMIKTSVLSYFNKDISNELLGISNSTGIINELVDKNLFIINVDEKEGIFRYHNIFGEFLRLQFEQYSIEIREQVHLKAAEVFEKQKDLDQSIKHLLFIKKYKRAISIIEKLGQNPKGWVVLEKIPNEILIENKGLTLQKFFHYFCNAEIGGCKDVIDEVNTRKDYEDMTNVLGFAMTLIEDAPVTNFTAISFEDIEKLDISEVTKAILYLGTSSFILMMDEYIKAKQFVERAEIIEKQYENIYIRYFVLNSKAQVAEAFGDLVEAENIYKKSFKLINQYPILGKIKTNAYIGITGILLKSYQLKKAEEALIKAEELVLDDYIWMRSGYLYNLIEYKLLKGEKKEAVELSEELLGIQKYSEYIYSGVINFLMIADNISIARLENYVSDFEKGKRLFENDKIVYAKALNKLGKEEKALAVINEILENSRRYGVKTKMVEAALIKIEILNRHLVDSKREIINLLTEAVHYSYENKYFEPFIFAEKIVRTLLVILQKERHEDLSFGEKKFIEEALTYLQPEKKEEILSAREKEVLEIMLSGATNKEISDKLYISVSTVKTHIINIYSKLGVSNRIEAVEKARERGITS